MHELGHLSLLLSLVASSCSGMATIVGHQRRLPSLESAGLILAYMVAALVTVSASCMLYLLVSGDFSVKYVYQHTDLSMPVVYLVSAFWGGQEGSLLFWLWVLSLYSALALWVNRGHTRLVPYANAVLMATIAFFVLLLLFAANPFSTWIGGAPSDGAGLNPMLQNPYMAVHPPTMYIGYIGMAVPFAFGLAAMASGQTDETWVRLCRRWTLVGWLFLSLGLILGKLWAYEELAWGGYWTWDPVENAGLLPWLTCTAFLHSVMIQERRGMFKRWNMTLVILSFAFTIVGTFITRSGIVQSVHSFAQSDIGHFFLGFLVFSLVVSFGLMWAKADKLRSPSNMESMLSREFAFGLNNWILIGMAFFLLLATLFPSLSDHLLGEQISVGEPFFNEWMVPLGLILLLLTGIGPLIAWGKASRDSLTRQFFWPALLGVAFAIVTAAAGALKGGLWPITTYALAGFVIGTIGQEVARGIQVRRRNTDESLPAAFLGLVIRGKRRYGGYVIHLGIVLMFIGWSGNAFQEEKEVSLLPGASERIGRFDLTYKDLRFTGSDHREEATARMAVKNLGGRMLTTLEPARWLFLKSKQPTTKVAIRTSIRDDLYVVLAGWDPDSEEIALRLVINPLVIWVWLGSLMLVIGTVIAVWPEGRHARRSPSKTSGLAIEEDKTAKSLLDEDSAAYGEHEAASPGNPKGADKT